MFVRAKHLLRVAMTSVGRWMTCWVGINTAWRGALIGLGNQLLHVAF